MDFIPLFSQSNPSGPGQGDVGALLRRVAVTLDELGDVQVGDITFSSAVTDGERVQSPVHPMFAK